MILLEISTFGAFFYAGAGILIFVVIRKLYTKKPTANRIEELPRDKWIFFLRNSNSYSAKYSIAKKIVHDSQSTREELEAVLANLEHRPLRFYQSDPWNVAYHRLILIRAHILHDNKIAHQDKSIQVNKEPTFSLRNFLKKNKTKKIEK